MRARRAALATLTVGLALMIGAPTPAAADAPTPTDFRSEVVEIDPSLPSGVEVQVVGGDSFLEVRARGHKVVVPDYDDATIYLRFAADGTVERNQLAVATAANDDRFGSADVVPDPDAEPRWETVATDGAYAWHDHRIHWMSPRTPTAVDGDGRVDLGGPDGRWQVPLIVDGTTVTVTGQLWLRPSPSPWPAIGAGIVIAALVVALGRRHARGPTALGLVVAVLAVGASAASVNALPAGIAGSWVPFAVSGVAVLSAVVALRAAATVLMVAQVALASALVGWGLARVDVLLRAELPTVLAAPADRAVTVTAIAVGTAIGALLLLPLPAQSSRSAVSTASSASP